MPRIHFDQGEMAPTTFDDDFAKAASIEEILTHKEEVLDAKNEMLAILHKFEEKVQIAEQLERKRRRRLDTEDAIVGIGFVALGVGLSVMYHWGFALIVLGAAVVSIAVSAKFVGAWKRGPTQ